MFAPPLGIGPWVSGIPLLRGRYRHPLSEIPLPPSEINVGTPHFGDRPRGLAD